MVGRENGARQRRSVGDGGGLGQKGFYARVIVAEERRVAEIGGGDAATMAEFYSGTVTLEDEEEGRWLGARCGDNGGGAELRAARWLRLPRHSEDCDGGTEHGDMAYGSELDGRKAKVVGAALGEKSCGQHGLKGILSNTRRAWRRDSRGG